MGVKNGCFFLDYYLAFLLIQCHLWSSNFCEWYSGYRIETSESVTVQRGLCVHVPCSFTVPSNKRLSINTKGIWRQVIDGTDVDAAEKNTHEHKTNGRFFITGNVSSGDCSYYIEDPSFADSGTYYFRFEDGSEKFTYRRIWPSVTVTELKDKPTMSSPRLVEGKEVTMTCTSPGRCRNTTPQISWDGNMTDIRQKSYNVTYEDDSKTFQSNITFTPRRSDHRSSIYCRVIFKQDVATVETQTLNVEYSPSMNITIEGVDTSDTTTVTVKDGDSITLKCIVDSNPNASITWYKEDKMVQRTTSNQTVSLTLSNITKNDTGRYQCSAGNEHGDTHRMSHVLFHSKESPISIEMAAVIGGVILFVLIIVIGAVLILYLKKKKKQTINGNLKCPDINDEDAIYCSPEFTVPNVDPPEENLQRDLQSSAEDEAVSGHTEDLQYSSIEFSKLKTKKVVPKDTEMEYAEIKKTQHD
ncbi:sialic acid-binding Ig-like lectin 13 [Leptodactylus fuscus]|uniref:sialic acid-binding Ig-like lectin 13 n=1 Tax=Leptodactylus fuscus TaxID=238119 RepID=UPI003F4EEECB